MKRGMRILLLVSALSMFAGGLFGPIYAVFVEGIGGDLLTAGGAYGVFAIIAGVLIYWISKWEDHVRHHEWLIIGGYAIGALAYFGYIFVETPLHLFAVQVLFGVAQAIGAPAYDGLYSGYLEKGKYASQWGLWESMSWIVAGISAIAGGWFALAYGFASLFVVMFAFSVIGFLASLYLLKINPKYRLKKH